MDSEEGQQKLFQEHQEQDRQPVQGKSSGAALHGKILKNVGLTAPLSSQSLDTGSRHSKGLDITNEEKSRQKSCIRGTSNQAIEKKLQNGSKKETKSTVGWKLSEDDVLDFIPLQSSTASLFGGSHQALRKSSHPRMKGGVRFAPSVEEEDDDTDDHLSPSMSIEALKRRRLTAFHSQLKTFKKSEIAKASVRHVLSHLSSLLCITSVLISFFAILDVEISYMCGTAYRLAESLNTTCASESLTASPIVLKSLISVCAVGMCGTLFVHYQYQVRYLVVVHQLPINATVIHSPLRNSFLMELLICFLHVPPVVGSFMPSELQLVSFLRLYLTGRYMKEHNHMMRSKSTRFLASVLRIELTSGYLIKTFFLKHPLVMITLCYLSNLFGSGYLVYAMDRYYNPVHHNNFMDTVWMQAVTMTTLGFGDVTPDSILGRVVVAISAVCGIFLMALLISVIHEGLQLTQQEKRILAYVERIEYSKRYKDHAARCIQATWRLHRLDKYGRSVPTKYQSCLASLGLVRPKRLLTHQLYDALFHWRDIKRSRTPEDQWVKEFVAENTVIMLTDVLRKMENLEDVLGVPREGESDQEEEEKVVHVVTNDDSSLSTGNDSSHHSVCDSTQESFPVQRRAGGSTACRRQDPPPPAAHEKHAHAFPGLISVEEPFDVPAPQLLVSGASVGSPTAGGTGATPPRKAWELQQVRPSPSAIDSSATLKKMAEVESKLDATYNAMKSELAALRALVAKDQDGATDKC